jgi:transposase
LNSGGNFFGTATSSPRTSRPQKRCQLDLQQSRRLNRAVHVVARTQAQWDPRAKAYIEKKRAEGKTRAEAQRCLKRRLSDVIYRTMTKDAKLVTPSAAA